MYEQVDLAKYRKEISSARVRVLEKILSCTTTTDDMKIMLTEERLENFACENETLFKIELKSRETDLPAKGSPEESARLSEISNLWMEVILMKAMIYTRASSSTSTASTE